MEETLMMWEIARRLGLTILYDGKQELPLDRAPTRDELLAIRVQGSRFTLDDLKALQSGIVVDAPDLVIQPARPEADALLDPMPADVAAEIAEFLRTEPDRSRVKQPGRPSYTHLLSSRRMRELFCSTGRHFSEVKKRRPYNPAFLAPEDMAEMQLKDGDRIWVSSEFASVEAIAQTDESLRPGVVSMAHGFGGLPEDDFDGQACVNALIDSRNHVEPINAMPRMSGIPVNISLANRPAEVAA
jgi:hypothetical protein